MRQRTKSEKEFFGLFKNSQWSTAEEDMHQHIDIHIDGFSIDVKELKRINRTDVDVNSEIHWVELQNVHGNKGWLYGEATHIAFELPDGFLLIERITLHQFCKHKVADRKIKDIKGLYTLYRRKGRLDVITLVLVEDLLKLPHCILNKQTLYESSILNIPCEPANNITTA